MTDNEKCCGHCKHLQIDGMFGMWCEKKHNWTEVKYCEDYERYIVKTTKGDDLND